MTDLLLPRELRLEWEKLPQFTLCANTGTQAVDGVCADLRCESYGGDACLFQFVRWREAEALAAAALAAATAENERLDRVRLAALAAVAGAIDGSSENLYLAHRILATDTEDGHLVATDAALASRVPQPPKETE